MFNRAIDPVLMEMLVCLVDEGSFTAAADRLHLTQQAVSAQMKRLEALTGREIVMRGQPGVRMTKAGEALLVHARQIISIMERVRRQFAAVPIEGTIRFGFTPGFGFSTLFPILSEIHRIHPHLELHYEVRRTAELLSRFNSNNLDVMIGAQPVGALRGEILFRQDMVWVGDSKNLIKDDEPIPLVMLPPPSFLRDQIFEKLSSSRISWSVFMESDDATALRAAVQAGWGMSVFNRALVMEDETLTLQAGHEDLPDPGQIEFFLLHGTGGDGPYQSFANVLRSIFQRGDVAPKGVA